MPSQTITWAKPFFLIFFSVFISFPLFSASTNWQRLQPGLEYQDFKYSYLTPWSHIHVFRVDLTRYQLNSVLAKDLNQKNASVDEYAIFNKSLIALNGGFFDKNYQPLGLRINNKKLKTPFKAISWWGVFFISNNQPYLVSSQEFQFTSQIDFAIQSGPRLIINGQIPHLKQGKADRTAIGITSQGKLIILVTENRHLSTHKLANLMQSPPLDCVNALNLDGGGSSQLRASLPSFNLIVPGFSPIGDAVTITEKN